MAINGRRSFSVAHQCKRVFLHWPPMYCGIFPMTTNIRGHYIFYSLCLFSSHSFSSIFMITINEYVEQGTVEEYCLWVSNMTIGMPYSLN